jgi:hypothetical protein
VKDKEFNESYANLKGGIEGSHVFASLVTQSYLDSPECALQVGLAVMLDKPICLIVDKGRKIPANLIKIAKIIEYADFKNAKDLERAAATVQKFAESIGDTK